MFCTPRTCRPIPTRARYDCNDRFAIIAAASRANRSIVFRTNKRCSTSHQGHMSGPEHEIISRCAGAFPLPRPTTHRQDLMVVGRRPGAQRAGRCTPAQGGIGLEHFSFIRYHEKCSICLFSRIFLSKKCAHFSGICSSRHPCRTRREISLSTSPTSLLTTSSVWLWRRRTSHPMHRAPRSRRLWSCHPVPR